MVAAADCWGNRTTVASYDEYGTPASTNWGRFGYTGQAWIPELQLWYYKARMYDPRLGRFLQVDPVGYDDQINLYAYVRNDPLNRSDPNGSDDVSFYGGDRLPPIEGNPFEDMLDFFAGDVVKASNNPTPKNIAVAVVLTFLPQSKAMKLISKAESVARKMGIKSAMQASAKGATKGARWSQGVAAVRIGRGNPRAAQEHLRNPYVKVTGPKGEVYDKHGKVIERTADVPKPGDTPEAHIRIEEFDPKKFPKVE